jgi:hypothetical protein
MAAKKAGSSEKKTGSPKRKRKKDEPVCIRLPVCEHAGDAAGDSRLAGATGRFIADFAANDFYVLDLANAAIDKAQG